MKYETFSVVRDTREKEGWIFEKEEKKPSKFQLLDTVVGTLNAGDYSIKGMESEIIIERKNGLCELFGNMVPKEHKERFEREMERLQHIKHKYLIIESNLNRDIWGLSVQQFKFPIPCSKIVDWLIELEQEYGIRIWFVGDAGKKVVRKIFENFLRKNG
jgi:hypothetical protein